MRIRPAAGGSETGLVSGIPVRVDVTTATYNRAVHAPGATQRAPTVKNAASRLMRAVIGGLEKRRRDVVLASVRGRLLDVGCGENRLVRQYGDGLGVDVFDWGDVDLVVENSAAIPLPDASFDTISFVACLNHIANREAVLREARRLLKPDGRLLATMIPPKISAVWHRIAEPWDHDQEHRGIHDGEVWGFTAREMRELLRKAGFRVERQQRFVFRLNTLYVASRTPDPPSAG